MGSLNRCRGMPERVRRGLFCKFKREKDEFAAHSGGRNWRKLEDTSKPWFEWVNKPESYDPCILTFEGRNVNNSLLFLSF